jgi:hypothetical protein
MAPNIVPGVLNSDFVRVCLFTSVQAGLSVGALITANGNASLQVMGKEWIALFCSAMLTSISHASAKNGTITAGKVG